MIGEMYPPAGGFWELGGFRGQNLWSGGTVMAPFDQRVYIRSSFFFFIFPHLHVWPFCVYICFSFILFLMSLSVVISFLTAVKMPFTRNRGPHLILLRWKLSGRAETNGYQLGMLQQKIILCKSITFVCISLVKLLHLNYEIVYLDE